MPIPAGQITFVLCSGLKIHLDLNVCIYLTVTVKAPNKLSLLLLIGPSISNIANITQSSIYINHLQHSIPVNYNRATHARR